jgi:hypothetical protein
MPPMYVRGYLLVIISKAAAFLKLFGFFLITMQTGCQRSGVLLKMSGCYGNLNAFTV